MKEKPIIFSAPMVRAILEGRKTQTRRVINPKIIDDLDGWVYLAGKGCACVGKETSFGPYKAGDILWLRETWGKEVAEEDTDELIRYLYKADGKDYSDWVGLNGETFHWRPSIFMPRAAARLFLEVKSVHVERLQGITEAGAKAEGAEAVSPLDLPQIPNSLIEPGGRYGKGQINFHSYRAGFYRLWDTLNAKRGYSWESNPWVWVIEFERVAP